MATRSALKKLAAVDFLRKGEPKHWREGDSRSERGRLIREALFKAAAEIVGDVGYQAASVAMITHRARVAQGTFYNYFESRQDILDQLLPALGQEMLDYVRDCAKKGATMLEKEELSFAAFFSFLQRHPPFFRILNEAESFAPKGYNAHLELVSKGYLGFFKRANERGDLPGFEEREHEVIVFILMAARSYLAWRYVYGAEKHGSIPKWVTSAYMKFVRYGLLGAPDVVRRYDSAKSLRLKG